jgi:hypothetical protein
MISKITPRIYQYIYKDPRNRCKPLVFRIEVDKRASSMSYLIYGDSWCNSCVRNTEHFPPQNKVVSYITMIEGIVNLIEKIIENLVKLCDSIDKHIENAYYVKMPIKLVDNKYERYINAGYVECSKYNFNYCLNESFYSTRVAAFSYKKSEMEWLTVSDENPYINERYPEKVDSVLAAVARYINSKYYILKDARKLIQSQKKFLQEMGLK